MNCDQVQEIFDNDDKATIILRGMKGLQPGHHY